jgi:hypothetical protein
MAQSKWYSEQPKNRNFLSPVGFKMELDLFNGVDFFCQRANIPDMSLPFTEVPTRFRSFPIAAAGGIQTGDLSLTFIIDEDLHNYMTIHNWIKKNGLYEEHSNSEAEYSGGRLEITTSNFNIAAYVSFENLFPISLSEVRFDVSDTDLEYFTADATFKYTSFELRNSKNKKL